MRGERPRRKRAMSQRLFSVCPHNTVTHERDRIIFFFFFGFIRLPLPAIAAHTPLGPNAIRAASYTEISRRTLPPVCLGILPSGFREPGLRRLSTETYVESECSVVVSSGDRCTRNKTTAVSRNNNTAVGGYGRKTRTFIHAQTTVTRHTASTETFGSARLREKLGNTRRGGGAGRATRGDIVSRFGLDERSFGLHRGCVRFTWSVILTGSVPALCRLPCRSRHFNTPMTEWIQPSWPSAPDVCLAAVFNDAAVIANAHNNNGRNANRKTGRKRRRRNDGR